MKTVRNRLSKDEKGFALVLTLVLLVVGALIVAPLLGFMSAGLRAGMVYEDKAFQFYAADAGVEDAMWKIHYDVIPEWMHDASNDDIYTHEPYQYTLSQQVNKKDVDVQIMPIWILDGLGAECLGQGVPANGMTPHQDFVMVGDNIGSVDGKGIYQISISYNGEIGELKAYIIGCWVPREVEYIEDSSNLDFEPEVFERRGGKALVWNFGPGGIDYDTLPTDDTDATKKVFTFEFTPDISLDSSFSWLRAGRNDIHLVWDTDIRLWRIDSQATDPTSGKSTTVETYTVTNELRKMSATISGDYRALGNSLMIDQYSDSGGPRRDTLLDESDYVVNDLPDDAEVQRAYLYWSGWVESPIGMIWQDSCDNFANWDNGSLWTIFNNDDNEFMGQGRGTSPESTLTMSIPETESLDLSSYQGKTVMVSWNQRTTGGIEPSDRLHFSFSGDGGATWSADVEAFSGDDPVTPFSATIPDEYLEVEFKMRFYLDFDNSSEYAYIDDIIISEGEPVLYDDSAFFKINDEQVYFDENGDPQIDLGQTEEITADPSNSGDRIQVINNLDYGNPHGYSYSCRKDVTTLVQTFADRGNAKYTVGGVHGDWDAYDEWAYAGWSLIIIYVSADTQGHFLYLYDDFLYKDHDDTFLDFDQDGEEGGTVSGFIVPEPLAGEVNAAKITCFVGEGDDYYNGDYFRFNGTKLWDGTKTEEQSLNDVWNDQSVGLSADGVDVDTFYVTWESNLLDPGDTSAQIDIWTEVDIWNLVYMIVSFRTENVRAGVLTFIVK